MEKKSKNNMNVTETNVTIACLQNNFFKIGSIIHFFKVDASI
ncbi:hypothetical protein BAOM_1015 [Peribacillus asahii]|uniref:Uncharacterized protein n=1 Tax=Peribacillus asahii TaxID=228899 RepID=A0A3T0KMK4_9BACI|nr:hypothetical protein BAOM_1015 [Peribacillus asahii]